MRCYMCNESAIGQCRACWKFYCSQHVDEFFLSCSGLALPRRVRTTFTIEEAEPFSQEQGPIGVRRLEVKRPAQSEALRHLIPVVITQEREGVEVTLLCVELYDSGFIINYRLRLVGEGRISQSQPILPLLSFSIRDSLGHTYTAGYDGTTGPLGDWRGSERVGPAISPEVEELTVVVTEIQWLSFAPKQETQQLQFQGGPWEFRVPLRPLAPTPTP